VNSEEIRRGIQDAIRSVLDNDTLALGEETQPRSLPNWDSLNQIKFVLTLETTFGVEFSSGELERAACIRDFVQLIAAKTASTAR
jgi:acyl carrier protein